MNRFNAMDICALLVLVILGILLIMGRDSVLTKTFCGIAGAIFTKGAGSQLLEVIKKAKVKGRLVIESDDKPATDPGTSSPQ